VEEKRQKETPVYDASYSYSYSYQWRPHTAEAGMEPEPALASLVRSSDDDRGTPSRGTTEA
jgi:hypothetical protein